MYGPVPVQSMDPLRSTTGTGAILVAFSYLCDDENESKRENHTNTLTTTHEGTNLRQTSSLLKTEFWFFQQLNRSFVLSNYRAEVDGNNGSWRSTVREVEFPCALRTGPVRPFIMYGGTVMANARRFLWFLVDRSGSLTTLGMSTKRRKLACSEIRPHLTD